MWTILWPRNSQDTANSISIFIKGEEEAQLDMTSAQENDVASMVYDFLK